MKNIMLVRMLKSARHFDEYVHGFRQWQSAAGLQQLCEGNAVNEVHDHERLSLLGDAEIVHGDDIWVSQTACSSRLLLEPEDCLFVGDSAADMEAGRRAGVRICAVDYGYGKPEALAAWNPDYSIGDLRELL